MHFSTTESSNNTAYIHASVRACPILRHHGGAYFDCMMPQDGNLALFHLLVKHTRGSLFHYLDSVSEL
jgi:hypothetical protein